MTLTDGVPADHARLPVLDGVRGVAILLVMLCHFVPGPVHSTGEAVVVGGFRAGWVGVNLFFVLSGYLITGILLETRDRPDRARRFYSRRALRIWPLYLLALVVLFFILPLTPLMLPGEVAELRRDWAWYWLHAVNVYSGYHGGTAPFNTIHFWSLAVEEQFYLLWPLVVWRTTDARLPRVCLLAFALAGLMRLTVALSAAPPVWWHWLNGVGRMDSLVVGAWLACMARRPGGLARYVGAARRLALAAGFVLVALALRHPLYHKVEPVNLILTDAVTALLFGACLVLAVVHTPRLLTREPFTGLGRYSYGLYVIHLPLVLVLERVGLGTAAIGRPAFLALAFAASFALALLSWHGWERHWLALRERGAALEERRHTVLGRGLARLRRIGDVGERPASG